MTSFLIGIFSSQAGALVSFLNACRLLFFIVLIALPLLSSSFLESALSLSATLLNHISEVPILLLFCVCYWFLTSFHLFNLAFCSAPSHLCFINDSECFLTSMPSVMMLEAERRKDSVSLLHIKASSEYWGFAAKGLQSKSLFTHVGIYSKVSLCTVTCHPPFSFLGPLPSCIF